MPAARLAELVRGFGGPAAAEGALAVLLVRLARPEAPTSVHDAGRAIDIHIADSLVGLEVEELRAAEVLADLGSGAGLPGLVLAAMLPSAKVTLVESQARKCVFLDETRTAMGVTNVAVVCARAEEWIAGRDACDAVTARALAPLAVLSEYAAPLLRPGGVLVAWKGAVDETEAVDGAAAAEILGLELAPPRTVVPYSGSQRRTLHVARKVAPTPPGYPRRPGIAAKRPLSAKWLR